jgi:hypothetical protein
MSSFYTPVAILAGSFFGAGILLGWLGWKKDGYWGKWDLANCSA